MTRLALFASLVEWLCFTNDGFMTGNLALEYVTMCYESNEYEKNQKSYVDDFVV